MCMNHPALPLLYQIVIYTTSHIFLQIIDQIHILGALIVAAT